ncbi:MAG: acylase [Candidatus Hydrogenedentes bacterium]|nr:acylase [Candidatus Hydrogenedentota bacterium]
MNNRIPFPVIPTLALCLAALFAGPVWAAPDSARDVRILRDEWGVPHIFGKTDADAAFGLGYAHAEDDWVNLQGVLLSSRGMLAAAAGPDYLNYDYLFRLFRVREFVAEKYEKELSPDTRAVVEAYAEGVTLYASAHPDKMPGVALPVTGQDIVAGTAFKSPFFYLLERDLAAFFANAANVPAGGRSMLSKRDQPEEEGDTPWWVEEVVGSNAWAVAPSRSADGATRLAVNSHMPWSGPVSFYEAHLHSGEGWNMAGAVFSGAPVILMGHDENKGWCHTINRPDLADIYQLEANPDNPNQYRFDGEWRDLEREMVEIPVMGENGKHYMSGHGLLWSVHGPAVRRKDGLFAIRFAGYGEIRQLEQWYRMNKATNLEEFKKALALVALPSLNTVYADKSGNILHLYNGQIPVRAEGYDWSGVLPGDTSKTLWQGFYPFEKLPQTVNPPSGFVQNCNSSPFNATVGGGNPRPRHFPKSMGIEGHETNRSRRARALYGGDDSITRGEFNEYKFDKTYTDDSDAVRLVGRLLKENLPDEPLLREAAALLKSWDHSTAKDNTAAALVLLMIGPHAKRGAWAGSPNSPVNLLRNAANFLMEHHGRLDPPLGDVLRLRHGTADLPLGGGPDCLRAVYAAITDDGHLVGHSGDCYYQMVEWDKEGNLTSQAFQPYGSAPADTSSPHYTDQMPLFSEERLRPVLLREEDIRKHLKREYRPGDAAGS